MVRELNVVYFQVRLSQEERDALEKVAGKRQMQAYVRALIREAIAGRAGYPYPRHRAEHESLEAILQGDVELAKAAKDMLKHYGELLEARRLEGRLKQTKAR